MAKKERKTRKPKSVRRKLKDDLMALAKAIVRVRDNYTCQCCGRKQLSGNNCHCSHVVPVSGDGRLAFDPINIKILCYQCHLKWHEDPLEHGWFQQKFPDRYEYVTRKRLENRLKGTITICELRDMLAKLRADYSY